MKLYKVKLIRSRYGQGAGDPQLMGGRGGSLGVRQMDGHGGSPVMALPGGLWEAGQVHIIELNADVGLQTQVSTGDENENRRSLKIVPTILQLFLYPPLSSLRHVFQMLFQ